MEQVNYEDTKDFIIASEMSNLTEPHSSEYSRNVVLDNEIPNDPNMDVMNRTVNLIPTNEEFAGQYNFELKLNHNQTSKHTWMYSQLLNKVFINMGNILPVDFKWNPPIPDLYIRATPLYASPQHSQETVLRCVSHSLSTDISNKDCPDFMHQHVIRCDHNLTRYMNSFDGRLSVRAPLGQPQAGTDSVRLTFRFMCKNSCPSGMNRKPLEVVYTLESANGEILGRRKHGVRICSCPRRDKDKEEQEYNYGSKKRRKVIGVPLTTSKRHCKEDMPDLTTYTIPIKIMGRENAKSLLKNAYNLMAGTAIRYEVLDLVKPCMNEIERKLGDLE